jgi:hypothetical protein
MSKGIMPIPPQLWFSEDNDTKEVVETPSLYDNKNAQEVTSCNSAELVFSTNCAENTVKQTKNLQNQGTCYFK